MPRAARTTRSRSTHAGGIVFRLVDGQPHYLLVAPKSGAAEWLLPKGHIERGETVAAAAVREVQEETGVKAALVAPVGTTAFAFRGEDVRARFHLMAWRADGDPDEKRRVRWFSYPEALRRLTHEQNRTLLERAEARRRDLNAPAPGRTRRRTQGTT